MHYYQRFPAERLRLPQHGLDAAWTRPDCRRGVATAATASVQELTITRPDDWHLHVRDDAGLKSVVPHTARDFSRAIIMPNLVPPVTTSAQVSLFFIFYFALVFWSFCPSPVSKFC